MCGGEGVEHEGGTEHRAPCAGRESAEQEIGERRGGEHLRGAHELPRHRIGAEELPLRDHPGVAEDIEASVHIAVVVHETGESRIGARAVREDREDLGEVDDIERPPAGRARTPRSRSRRTRPDRARERSGERGRASRRRNRRVGGCSGVILYRAGSCPRDEQRVQLITARLVLRSWLPTTAFLVLRSWLPTNDKEPNAR